MIKLVFFTFSESLFALNQVDIFFKFEVEKGCQVSTIFMRQKETSM